MHSLAFPQKMFYPSIQISDNLHIVTIMITLSLTVWSEENPPNAGFILSKAIKAVRERDHANMFLAKRALFKD